MNQLIKELKQLREGLSKAIIAKFLKLSHNTTGTLE